MTDGPIDTSDAREPRREARQTGIVPSQPTVLALLDIDSCAHPYDPKDLEYAWPSNTPVTLENVKNYINTHNPKLVKALKQTIEDSGCQQVVIACGSARQTPGMDLYNMLISHSLPAALVLQGYEAILREKLGESYHVALNMGAMGNNQPKSRTTSGNMTLDFAFNASGQETYYKMRERYKNEHNLKIYTRQGEKTITEITKIEKITRITDHDHVYIEDEHKTVLVPHQIAYMRERLKLQGPIHTYFFDDRLPILTDVDATFKQHKDKLLACGDSFGCCHFNSNQPKFVFKPAQYPRHVGTKMCFLSTSDIWQKTRCNYYRDYVQYYDDQGYQPEPAIGEQFFADSKMPNVSGKLEGVDEKTLARLKTAIDDASQQHFDQMRNKLFCCLHYWKSEKAVGQQKNNFFDAVQKNIQTATSENQTEATRIQQWAYRYAAATRAARYQQGLHMKRSRLSQHFLDLAKKPCVIEPTQPSYTSRKMARTM